MAGIKVDRERIDIRLGDAALALRNAFDQVDNVFNFLQNNPVPAEGPDPLVGTYLYTTDEAYLIRFTFESLKTLHTNNENLVVNLSKFTGLE